MSDDGIRVVGVDILDQASGPCDEIVRADPADHSVPSRLVADHGPFDVLVNNAALFIHLIGSRNRPRSHPSPASWPRMARAISTVPSST